MLSIVKVGFAALMFELVVSSFSWVFYPRTFLIPFYRWIAKKSGTLEVLSRIAIALQLNWLLLPHY